MSGYGQMGGLYEGGTGDDVGFSLPLYDPIPSSSRQVYCVDCGGYVSNYLQCLDLGHNVPAYPTLYDDAINVQQHGDVIDANASGFTSGFEDLFDRTISTQSSWAYNTGFSTGDSNPQDPIMLHRPQSVVPMDTTWDTSLVSAPQHIWNSDVQPRYQCGTYDGQPIDRGLPSRNEHRETFVAPYDLTDAQVDTLERYRQRWIGQSHYPSDAEVISLATLESLAPNAVRSWFDAHLYRPLAQSVDGMAGEEAVNEQDTSSRKGKQPARPHPPATKPSQTVAEVMEWARARFSQPCRSPQTDRATGEGPLQCTSSPLCGYSTSKRDAWQRHEGKWQPQEFWHCVLCRGDGKKPFICSRKDKFFAHIEVVHKNVGKERFESLRNHSEVTFDAGFEHVCKFVHPNGRQCEQTFADWEERIRHYLAHFQGLICDGPWNLRYGRDRWFDDDERDDDQGSTGPSGRSAGRWQNASGSSSSGTGGQPGHSKSDYSGHTRGSRQAAGTEVGAIGCEHGSAGRDCVAQPLPPSRGLIRSAECSTSHATRPSLLISVRKPCLVPPPPNAKYLALDHTWALPVPTEEAIAFAKDLGYQYLWIADLCEPHGQAVALQRIFERASLTMVSVKTSEHQQRTLHFACRHDNIPQVHSWAKSRLSICHVRNLGHGAYGIVDEVMLRSTTQCYARKELSASRIRTKHGEVRLGEIELMQKLDHPHLTRFGAAYYEPDLRTWNILMTPVAQCTLRDYLADPEAWPEKHYFLAQWYMCLTSAVEYLHGVSCRHEDIKPANILISGHDVLLTDFGTSLDFSGDDSPDASQSEGRALMTPKYCAPEVADEARRGRKADVFSLGCVLAEMITVEIGLGLPEMHSSIGIFQCRRKQDATYHQHLLGLSGWLQTLEGKTNSPRHRRILGVCRRMVAFSPGDRPSASVVFEELSAKLESEGWAKQRRCPCYLRRDAYVASRCLDAAYPPQPASSIDVSNQYSASKGPSRTPQERHLASLDDGSTINRLTKVTCKAASIPASRTAHASMTISYTGTSHYPNSESSAMSFQQSWSFSVTLFHRLEITVGGLHTGGSRDLAGLAGMKLLLSSRTRMVANGRVRSCEREGPLETRSASRQATSIHHDGVDNHARGPFFEGPALTADTACIAIRHPRTGNFGRSLMPVHAQDALRWRRAYRKALNILRLVVSNRRSKTTSSNPESINPPHASKALSMWPTNLDSLLAFVEPDTLTMLLLLIAYNLGDGADRDFCVTAVVLALLRVEYPTALQDGQSHSSGEGICNLMSTPEVLADGTFSALKYCPAADKTTCTEHDVERGQGLGDALEFSNVPMKSLAAANICPLLAQAYALREEI